MDEQFNNQNGYQYQGQQGYYQAPPQQNFAELYEDVNIGLNIVLCIITCGIYSFIWAYQLMKKIRIMQNDSNDVGTELICYILVPFYNIYWFYTRAQRLTEAQRAWGKPYVNDNSVLYLILALFGFQIISVALMQNELNDFAKFLRSAAAQQQQQPPYSH